MTYLYQTIFYRPILNVLLYFYQTIAFHDFGIAIILVTILIRLVLFPLFHKSVKNQMQMQRLQPKMKKIQEIHKDDREKQAQALTDLYKEHGVNPFLSILLLIVQLPIMIALYWVVRLVGTGNLAGVYPFLSAPQVNVFFLGHINLASTSIMLLVLAALSQYFQAKLAIWRDPSNRSAPSSAEKIARNMMYVGPVMTMVVFWSLPSGVDLYWLVTSIFSIFQQVLVNRHFKQGESAAI